MPRAGAAEMQAAASFHTNARQAADLNDAYRRVLFTGVRSQLALMTLAPGEDIGVEVHPHVEQIVLVTSGRGKAIIGRTEWPVTEGDVIVITPGETHDLVNTGSAPLRIFTVYSPPQHMDGVVHLTKEAAESDEADRTFGKAVR
jgi:mannose-6-phosphate isomerase-like protein (cupin superfamily)